MSRWPNSNPSTSAGRILRGPALLHRRRRGRNRVPRLTGGAALRRGARARSRSAPGRSGEFTLRAFLNAASICPGLNHRDLIEATTLYQARIAAQQAGGSVRAASRRSRAASRADRSARSGHRFCRRRRRRRDGRRDSATPGAGSGGRQPACRQLPIRRLVRAGLTLASWAAPTWQEQPFNRLLNRTAHRRQRARHHARPGFRDCFHRRHPREAVRHRRHTRGRSWWSR